MRNFMERLRRIAPRSAHLAEVVCARYDNGDPGHDFAHVMRVVGQCIALCEAVGADPEICVAAALLHDVVNVPKNHPDRALASEKAARAARELLATAAFSPAEMDRIATAIVEHSYSRGLAPSSPESAVLQDADRLDALGAIGLMRTVTCGARLDCAYYHPDEPRAETRPLDDRRYTLDHLDVKLFKLAAGMNTVPAKAEAERRSAFMREFLKQLNSEIT